MSKAYFAVVLLLCSSVALAQDFVQCWSDQNEAPEQIIRLNIDREEPTVDSEGNELITRHTTVAVGMDIVVAVEATGVVSDERIDVTLVQDDIIVGSIEADRVADHPYLLRGTVKANGTRNDDSAIVVNKQIECVRHSLGN